MSIYEKVARKARREYWNKRGCPGSEDRLPSEQVESVLKALCEAIDEVRSEIGSKG